MNPVVYLIQEWRDDVVYMERIWIHMSIIYRERDRCTVSFPSFYSSPLSTSVWSGFWWIGSLFQEHLAGGMKRIFIYR